MKNNFYDQILEKYLLTPRQYNNKKVCLEYSDGDMYDSMGEDYQAERTLLLWDKKPTKKMFKEVKCLVIDPERINLYPEDTPDFINQFESLESLNLPLVYALHLTTLPITLKSLTIINDRNQTNNIGDKKKDIKNNLMLGDVRFPSVTSLNIITLSSADMVADGFMDINEKKFPNLEFLRCIISPKDKFNPISSFTNLKHIWVSARGKKCKLFESLPEGIQTLYIDGANDDVDFSPITRFKNLEIIYLNSIYSPVDCKVFASLPNLKEIILMNSNFINNVDSLLDIPTLKSIEILDCKNITNESMEVLSKHTDRFK